MTFAPTRPLALALLLTAAAAPAAQAGLLALDRSQVREHLVVTTAADVNDPFFLQGASNFSGVGGLIINTNAADAAGFVNLCTGSLISSRVVLTAAHCLDAGDVNRVRFRTGAGTLAPSAEYEASHFWIHPNFQAIGGFDVATLILDTPVSNGEAIYGLYRNRDEQFQIHTKVGFGTTGELATGQDDNLTDFAKRAGFNEYGATADEIFFDVGDDVLLYDSDSGLFDNDVFGFAELLYDFFGLPNDFQAQPGIYANRTTGVLSMGIPAGDNPADWRLVEVTAAPGDSGGPTYIDGLIAGITSFGISGAIFDGDCGPGLIDPSFVSAGFDPDGNEIKICTNSSFGELGGDTRVSSYADLLDFFVASNSVREIERLSGLNVKAVPAPGALALFGLGLLGLAALRRR